MICKLIEKVSKTIEKNDLVADAKTICVGVSGGADSVCLLDVLCHLKETYDFELTVLHINHLIRGDEAERDAEFVRKLCNERKIKFILVRKNIPEISRVTGESEEECGRRIRYEAFAETGCDLVAVAHTLSDSIETSLFNLSRGTGLKGAGGIKVKRDNIIRPLIDCTRSEIEEYCNENSLEYITDSTNLTDDYARNFIRHRIVESFKAHNPSFESNYRRFMETAAMEDDFLDECAERLLYSSKKGNEYRAEPFLSSHKAVATRALYKLLKNECEKTADNAKVTLLYSMLLSGNGEVELCDGVYVRVCSDKFFVRKASLIAALSFDVKANKGVFDTPVGSYELVYGGCELKDIISFKNLIDADKLKDELIIRNRRDGDRFSSPIRKNTKSLKKLFNEMHIEQSEREKKAIFCDGCDIVWIEDVGTASNYAVSNKTERYMYIKKTERG